MKIKAILLLSLSLLTYQAIAQSNGVLLVDKMIAFNKTVKAVQLNADISERINGKMVDKTGFFKIQLKPQSIYFRQKIYFTEVEGIYLDGANQGKVQIVTRSFPKIKMNLDPLEKKMREDNQHTIFEAGFDYFIHSIELFKNKYPQEFPSMVSVKADERVGNKMCKVIEINNPHFRYTYYKALNGETLRSIGFKLNVSDQMILELNPSCKNHGPVKAGQKILVPTDYARKMVLYIDIKTSMPIRFDVYDDKGLYAHYVYSNVLINPTFAANEFSVSNPQYKFQ